MGEKAIMNWSGGKDSALSLYKILQKKDYEVECLLTSVSSVYDRISMHGVRSSLLDAQCESLGFPSVKMMIPEQPSMEIYDNIVSETIQMLKSKGVTISIFGDIFLEDLRTYRETKLSELDISAVFPLWNIPTHKVIDEFLSLGFKTIVTCVNEQHLDKSFVGRTINQAFLNDLPKSVDPCGENGEFHTFVYDGPIFSEPVAFDIGDIVYRTYPTPKDASNQKDYGFWFCDLVTTP